jgi:hypothetical protein
MRIFSIEGGKDTPFVYLDESKKLVEISGNSTLKDAHWFYTNVLKWLIAFNTGPYRTETINLRFLRINDSTVKWLPLIFNKLDKIFPGSALEINWYLQNSSSRLRESGQLLKSRIVYKVNMRTQYREKLTSRG